MQKWTRRTRWAATLLVSALALSTVAAGAEPSDQDLRNERDRLRSEQAALASQIDVGKASLEEITAALADIEANVRVQQAHLEEAEKAVAAAEQAVLDALAAQEAAEAEVAELKETMAAIAVNAYVSPPQQDTLQVMLDGDLGSAPERQALLDLRVSDQADVLERYRAAQEDLARYAEEAQAAEQQAEEGRAEVKVQLEALEDSRAIQADLAAEAQILLDDLMFKEAAADESANKITAELTRREEQREKERLEALQRQLAEASARRGPVSLPSGASVNLSRVGGIVVNSAIADQVAAMLSAAAADGITLTGGGYRDSSVQIALRTKNGCPDVWTASPSRCRVPTAIPGRSMHERGLAIDFNNCSSRSTACFQWLARNAARFGFKNLPSEPWHWSTTGG